MSTEQTTDETPALHLLDMDASEAQAKYQRGELTDRDFERWATLNDLEDQMAQLKAEIAEAERTVIEGSIEADGDALTDKGEWFGVTIEYQLQIDEWMVGVFESLDNRVEGTDDFDTETLSDLKQDIAELLAVMWRQVETDQGMQSLEGLDDDVVRDWILAEFIEDPKIGFRGAYICLTEQIQHATRRERKLQGAVEKFRGETGRRDGGADATDGLHDTVGTLHGDE